MKRHPARLIQAKRAGLPLDAEEIDDLVSGVVDGSLHDAQLGALLMAVCLQGMTPTETAAWTRAMRDSGTVMRKLGAQRRIDKHSTGGVGDKTSLVLAPLLAAAGVAVPMISGRGLGHTGGTIDKLESIPGYRTGLDLDEFDRVLAACGFAMASASRDIAPADRRMYAIRDISGTVESIPLITSSILSKKLAENLDGLVMDVKQGRAAFMPKAEDADRLLDSIVAVGRSMGLPITALRTDMDHPLGRFLGNALEVREILDCCRGEGPADTQELVMALAVEMGLLAGIGNDADAVAAQLDALLRDGSVLARLRQNIELQGGDPRIVDDPSRLGLAPTVVAVEAARDGFVADVDPLEIGHVIVELGGGRRHPTDQVDPLVGLELCKQKGDPVQRGEPLAFVHARTAAEAQHAAPRVAAAMPVGDARTPRGPLVLRRVGS